MYVYKGNYRIGLDFNTSLYSDLVAQLVSIIHCMYPTVAGEPLQQALIKEHL